MNKKDDGSESKQEGGEFLCTNCGLKEKYQYYGKKPPFAKLFKFHEDVYVSRDPFSAPTERNTFLLLGANCCNCCKLVCQAKECSVFYSKTFCLKCALENIDEFPEEMKKWQSPMSMVSAASICFQSITGLCSVPTSKFYLRHCHPKPLQEFWQVALQYMIRAEVLYEEDRCSRVPTAHLIHRMQVEMRDMVLDYVPPRVDWVPSLSL